MSNTNWVLSQFCLRLGDPYVYGGDFSPTDLSQGCDCSYAVGWVLEGLVNGPDNMSWDHNVSTESWPYDYSTNTPAAPGTVGPYGTIAVATVQDIPDNAALVINVMHGGGGVDSHINCVLDGIILESNGDSGVCTIGTGGTASDSSEWTDHWYLPASTSSPVPSPSATTLYYPDVSNNNWSSTFALTNFLSQLAPEGFAGVVHKVSEGDYYSDPYWSACQQWCQQNNLPCLGYHYVTTDSPDAQAAQWNSNGGGHNAMLDFEANSGDMNNFWAVVNAFNNAGVNIQLVYLPNWYWGEIGQPDLSALPANQIFLVSSNYPDGSGYASVVYENSGGDTGRGWAPYGGCTPSAWQFTDSANVAGINVDCNAYLGSDIRGLFGA